jgi:ribose transport system ATP-binding protein
LTRTPLLELDGIAKSFGGIDALKGVSLDLRAGEVHALVGENGAGKSTLMKILAGVIADFEGSYRLAGKPLRLRSPRDALQSGIGMIHQELSVLPELSVAENLFLGRQPRNRLGLVDWKTMHAVARRELSLVGFDTVDPRRPLGDYPLGVHQVVEVLGVIHSGARILIMDEPTSALSPAEVERFIDLIGHLRGQGRSIIFISHFLEDVMRVADRITVLRNGRAVVTVDRESTSIDKVISQMLGHEVDARLAAPRVIKDLRPLLEVDRLGGEGFGDVSFTVLRGEIIGLYGAVGAGQFEVARALFGQQRTSAGTIAVDGRRLSRRFSTFRAIRLGLAYASESRRLGLFLRDPVYKNVTLPHLRRLVGLVPGLRKEVAITRPAIAALGLSPPDPMMELGNFSGGNQQKVAIARWLTVRPKVLILSEPTRGMDVGAKGDVMRILRDLRNDGFGVVIASSEPETVLAVADRIASFSRGSMRGPVINQGISKDMLIKGL